MAIRRLILLALFLSQCSPVIAQSTPSEALKVNAITGALTPPFNEAAFKSANHMTIGTDVQAYNAALAAISANTGSLSLSGLTLTLPTNVATKIAFLETGTGAVSNTLDAILRTRAVNVKNFGALGNDSHDDTSACQAAANAAAAQLRPLYFPSGTYKITSALNIGWEGMEVFGDGEAVSTIKQYTTNQNAITVAYAADGLFNLHDFGLSDSSALGNTSTSSTATGLLLNGTLGPNYTNCRIANIAIEGFYTGIDFNNVDITTVTNVFTSSGDTGFYVHGNSNNISFWACPIYPMQSARYGYHFDGSGGGNTCSVNGTDLLGQTTGSPAVLIRIDGMYGAAVRNVSIENNPGTGYPLELTGAGTCMVDGLILRTNTNTYGIHMASSSSALTIGGGGFAGTNAKIRVDKDSAKVCIVNTSPLIIPTVDCYASGVLVDTYKASPNSLIVDSTPAGFFEGTGTGGTKDSAAFVWSPAGTGGSKYLGLSPNNIATDAFSFVFSTHADLSSGTEAMRLDPSGNLTVSGGLLCSALWPGVTTSQQNSASMWMTGNNGGRGFWRFPGGISGGTSVALDFLPNWPANSIGGTFRMSSTSQYYSVQYTVSRNQIDGFGGAPGAFVIPFTGYAYLTASGSVTVADGDTITDGNGASAKAIAGTGTVISFRWINGSQWFTTGATLLKNGSTMSVTVSDPGPIASASTNKWAVYFGYNTTGPGGLCLWNGTGATYYPSISLEF